MKVKNTPDLLPGIEPGPLLTQRAPYTKGVPIGLPPFKHHHFCAITCKVRVPIFWASGSRVLENRQLEASTSANAPAIIGQWNWKTPSLIE